jgi:hypothetical protein
LDHLSNVRTPNGSARGRETASRQILRQVQLAFLFHEQGTGSRGKYHGCQSCRGRLNQPGDGVEIFRVIFRGYNASLNQPKAIPFPR